MEILYLNYDVSLAILNLHLLIMKEKGVKKINACIDGTVYSITIKKHYASETQIRKDERFGMRRKSEKEAFDKAMEMPKHIEIESVRLKQF